MASIFYLSRHWEKTAFLALLLFFYSFWCIAQEQYTFEIKPKPGKKEVVNFSILETIDARIFTKNCGFVPNKNGTELIPAVFDGGLENAFDKFLPHIFDYTDSTHQITLVVREFHISETNTNIEHGQFSILLDFYLVKEGKYTRLLRFDDFQSTTGFNVTKSHCNNLIKSIQSAGRKLASINWQEQIENSENLVNSRSDLLQATNDFAILKSTTYQAGIYQSFVEFINNSPSITDVEITIKKAKSEEYLSKKEVTFKNLPNDLSTADLSKTMWGFSDGENIYINNWAVSQDFSYSRFNTLGKFCLFIGKESMAVGNRLTARNSTAKKTYIFDTQKGQAYLLNDQYLSTILQLNSSLLHRYQQESDKKNPNTQIWYAKELNQLVSSN